MNANDYQKWTESTAIYPESGTGSNTELYYLAMGLTSEAGEVAGKIKKLLRDNKLDIGNLIYELGDVLWYTARLVDSLGYEMEDVMEINYNKLNRRKETGTLSGNGDER